MPASAPVPCGTGVAGPETITGGVSAAGGAATATLAAGRGQMMRAKSTLGQMSPLV